MYTDDTVLFTSAKSSAEIETALADDFGRVADWLEANEMIVNMKKGKTESMLFGTKRRLKENRLKIKYKHKELKATSILGYNLINQSPYRTTLITPTTKCVEECTC